MAKQTQNTARTRVKKTGVWRYIVLALLFVGAISVYVCRLSQLQLSAVSGDTVLINGQRIAVTQQRVKIKARRGSILDRDGTPLVQDVLYHSMVLDAGTFPTDDHAANELLCQLLTWLSDADAPLRASSCPITEGYADDRYLFFLKPDTLSADARERYENYLTAIGLSDRETLEANALLDAMYRRYHLYAEEETAVIGQQAPTPTLLYDPYMAYRIACIRYDLEVLRFDESNDYLLTEDADASLITPVMEQHLRGVSFRTRTERAYCYPGYASHILGHTGLIPAASVDRYTEMGYPMDAVVGIDGIEGAMEQYLRAVDGEMLLEVDGQGNVVRQTVLREPIAGRDVYLTIDIDLQTCAEDALAQNIADIVERGISSGEEHNGEDAAAGALVVIDPENGAVLASASYPSYDLSAYSANYTALSSDPALPLFNRALMGTYAPGSVFKVGVAAAAMEEGIIDADTVIDTKGVYTYYDDYQPRCWIYTNTGLHHGKINVVSALRDSCNYFFFDVGRQLGITKLASFMSSLGLGQKTGTELPESAGILSTPDYTKEKGIPWTGAALLQTAIGQGYNAFTPMQIASYLSTVVNGGTRYEVHYVRGIADASDTDAPDFSDAGNVLDTVVFDEETHATLIHAMHEVAVNGSATRIFRGYGIPVGAKTGTAEVGENESPNAVFAGFAPLDDPELLCVAVIENGASGTNAGFCVRDVFDLWFSER